MSGLILYHDFASAYSRVAVAAGREAAATVGLALHLVPLERFPAPAPLPDPEAAFAAEVSAAAAIAEACGVRLEVPPLVPRTRKAHEAVAFARAQGDDLAMALALYDAFWHQGRDIGRIDVVAEVGSRAGLDPAALHVALGTDVHAQEVTAEQEAAVAEGVEGLPTFRIGTAIAPGLLAPAELAAWIESVG